MKYARFTESTYALRLEPGDDVLVSIQSFCGTNNIAKTTGYSTNNLAPVESQSN
jgi:predicted DNA-binding protein with PD1-like motif